MRNQKLKILKGSWSMVALCFLLSTLYSLFSIPVFAEQLSSQELIIKAWEAHGKGDIEATFDYTQQYIDLYKDEAGQVQLSLKALPKNKEEIEAVGVLNDVATAYFIQAESLMRQNKLNEAKKIFQIIIDECRRRGKVAVAKMRCGRSSLLVYNRSCPAPPRTYFKIDEVALTANARSDFRTTPATDR